MTSFEMVSVLFWFVKRYRNAQVHGQLGVNLAHVVKATGEWFFEYQSARVLLEWPTKPMVKPSSH